MLSLHIHYTDKYRIILTRRLKNPLTFRSPGYFKQVLMHCKTEGSSTSYLQELPGVDYKHSIRTQYNQSMVFSSFGRFCHPLERRLLLWTIMTEGYQLQICFSFKLISCLDYSNKI